MKGRVSLQRKWMVALAIVLILQLVMGVTASYAAPPTSPHGRFVFHVVRTGETLFSIGRLYSVSPWAIARVNHLWNPDCILVGQVLKIPIRIYAPRPCAPCGPRWGRIHWVRPGETLWRIGWYYGVSPWAIARANGLWNPNCIYAGQKLWIPWN
ncbi:MAG: LysM domain-containing protein [Anaerolineae bacterium]